MSEVHEEQSVMYEEYFNKQNNSNDLPTLSQTD